MKIGIGIDTGGTCTDAVIYQFEEKKILAAGKTPTTREDLSIGIGKALDALPAEQMRQAEVIALSTTLATNACVENKGGRAKLIFFGVSPANVERVGAEYGLVMDESLIFVESKTKPSGEIVEYPDWDAFEAKLHDWLDDCDAVGVVELYARKSGAQLEKKAQELIRRELDIPVVCGYSLFSESNIIKRGASALLNARLLFVIEEFLQAVEKALRARHIDAPFVIVRSDGSLMSGEFTATRPVETLLCGPVASVMGASELTREENCVVVDIGGTTTDMAFVKNGLPQRVKSGVRIGKWNTFVKGLFVDTFGLGGDSGVVLSDEKTVALEEEKVMPLCMAAARYPSLLRRLQRENERGGRLLNRQKNIYVRIRDIGGENAYTAREREIASLLAEPLRIEELAEQTGETVLEHHLQRLIREGVLIRCGVTPTDVMHLRGDFTAYNAEASHLGLSIMARALDCTANELGERIYDEFRRKLYCNLVRVLLEDAYPSLRQSGLGAQTELLIRDSYDRARRGEDSAFLSLRFSTPATLVGVGAPTALFLGEVGKLLGAKVVTSEYSPVANALGAVVGNVSADAAMEVVYQMEEDSYTVAGCGQRIAMERREDAERLARQIAREKAREEVLARGADAEGLEVSLEETVNIVETEFGSVYMGYKAVATAAGRLRLPARKDTSGPSVA